ncbi:hypothetical protein BDB01DRAFT_785757 [Pilobolus umbonatus]|nr:hypothetical protein BDB01DRAFT_785757 [Pilobolus umbonatus]
MQTKSLEKESSLYINSYTCNQSLGTSSNVLKNKINKRVSKPKKIMLRPSLGKQKMSLEELQALNRQIKPLSYMHCHNNIKSISRSLKENLYMAKLKMMESLRNSNLPQDIQIYKYLNDSTPPPSPGFTSSSEDEEYPDDCSSVSTKNSMSSQLRLVTDDSGFVSIVYTNDKPIDTPQSKLVKTDTMYNTRLSANDSPLQTLDTPSDYYTTISPLINMSLLFPWIENSLSRSPSNDKNNDVTEDQIDLWLQRGGGDYYSPITMATDQELADLLDFDM